jgi:nucleoside-diphosphate-sugar epimerase
MDAAAKNNSVLVTGGRGFVGRAVVKLLLRAGYRVISLDTSAPVGGDDCESVHEVVCDIGDADKLRRVFEAEPIGGIVHLAAILPTAAEREPVRATRVNVDGSLHLLEMAGQFGIRRLLFGSSLSIYGTCAIGRVVSEMDVAAPEDLYGAAKLYVERLGQTYRDGHGLEFVSLRIGRVVGPGARSVTSPWRSEIFEFLNASRAVEIAVPYVGSERILLVNVDDVARMLVTLLRATSPEHAVYNAVCESITVADLKREVEALNSNVKIKIGAADAKGNPRLLDSSRFAGEFGFTAAPIREQLRSAVGK